ncbi:hypothetical protein D3C84_1008680 [compost metagenome]
MNKSILLEVITTNNKLEIALEGKKWWAPFKKHRQVSISLLNKSDAIIFDTLHSTVLSNSPNN